MKNLTIYTLAATALLAGCMAPPGTAPKLVAGPDGALHTPVEVADGGIHQIGGTLSITSYTGGTTGTVTFKNAKTGVEKTTPLNFAGGATAAVPLDATVLPDFAPNAKVQKFNVRADVGQNGGGKDIFVVADPGVQTFPNVTWSYGQVQAPGDGPRPMLPPGKWPMSPDPTQAGVESYLQRVIAELKLESPTVAKTPIARGEVEIPTFLKDMPADIPLVQARVTTKFPLYLVPEAHSPSRRDDVFVPTAFSMVITQSDPAILVSLTAQP